MTNELKYDPTKINKATTQSISNSLYDKIKARQKVSKHTLLIDLSGSMKEMVREEGKSSFECTTKFEILQDLMTKIPEGIKKYGFNGASFEITNNLPYPAGGTAMHRAFHLMKQEGKNEIVLITDGLPDSEEMALHESRGLKIDIIYIGPQPQPKFLEKLANMSGGSFTNINLIQAGSIGLLESKVQLLLGE